MRFLIQRVKEAAVTVNNDTIGKISSGFLVFVGICETDTTAIADKMIQKMIHLRIFEDEHGKINYNIKTVNGSLLIISQFTLYADCKKGNRPSFIYSGSPAMANELYEYMINKCQTELPIVESGIFGADMKVSLINDGPFTIMLDSSEICSE